MQRPLTLAPYSGTRLGVPTVRKLSDPFGQWRSKTPRKHWPDFSTSGIPHQRSALNRTPIGGQDALDRALHAFASRRVVGQTSSTRTVCMARPRTAIHRLVGGTDLALATIPLLFRGTRRIGVRAEDTAVAGFRSQDRAASKTVIEELTRVDSHRLGRLMAARGTRDGSGQAHHTIKR